MSTTKQVEVITTELETSCTDTPPCAEKKDQCGDWNMEHVLLWVVALLFILFWTIAMVWACCAWSSNGNKSRKGCKDDDDNCGAGYSCFIGGFIVWLVVLLLFIGVVWAWGWAGLGVFLVVIFLLAIILCGCFCRSDKKHKSGRRSKDSESC